MKRIISLLLLLAMSFGIASGANAQQLDPSKKPAPGPVPKAVFPPFTETTLKNGVRVIIVEDHKQPMVYLRTAIMSGSASDGRYQGAANAVAALLDAGTTSRTKEEIARKLDFYGASVGAAADADGLDVFTSSMKKDLANVLPLFADVILNASFPAAEVDQYINEQISGLTAEKKNSAWPGRMLGRKLIYGEHPYGAIPSEETFKSLSSELLNTWHDNNFVANNAIIAVVGDIKKAEVVPMLEKYFGSWKKGTVTEPVFPALKPISGTPIYLINRPGSVQSTVRLQQLGLKRNDANYDQAGFLAAIFAGNGSIGFQNRLFQNIREKHAYTYTPGGSLTASIDPGVIVAVAEVRNAVTDSALEQMLYEYRRLSNEPVNTDELTAAKSIVVGNYLMSLADPGMTAQRAIEIAKYNLPKNYFTTLASRINGMSAAELQKVGRMVYPPNDVAIIVTGDAAQIKDKLTRFGNVQVYDLNLEPMKAQSYAPADKSLDQVIQLVKDRIGASVMGALTSRQMKGKITIDAGPGQIISGDYTATASAPNNQLEHIVVPAYGNMVIEQGTNGTIAWMAQPQYAQMEEPMKAMYIEGNLFNEELHLTDMGRKTQLLGTKDFNGTKVYVLEVTAPSGSSKNLYVDPSGLIVGRQEIGEGGENIVTLSDFRNIEGVMYPFKIQSVGAQNVTIELTEIKHNVDVSGLQFGRTK
jgi:predicted Zn-dependent peptidase